MASKRDCSSSRQAPREVNRTEEWVQSVSDERALNNLVVLRILLDRVMVGWHPIANENFPMPHSGELVVFEDYFIQGFDVLIHPFLHRLIDHYGISLCNLSPNSILHVAIFINLCEAYLGILPHFDLFHHFFCVKMWGGGAGSKVVGSAYLHLQDGMASQYIAVSLNTNVK